MTSTSPAEKTKDPLGGVPGPLEAAQPALSTCAAKKTIPSVLTITTGDATRDQRPLEGPGPAAVVGVEETGIRPADQPRVKDLPAPLVLGNAKAVILEQHSHAERILEEED